MVDNKIQTDNTDLKLNSDNEIKENNNSNTKFEDSFNLHFLTEEEVGITEYLNKHKGFSCVLKHRFSDFIVNEIDLDGKVVWGDKPKQPEQKELKEVSNENKEKEILDKKGNNNNKKEIIQQTEEEISEILNKELSNLLKPEDMSTLKEFIIKYQNKELSFKDFVHLSYIQDKENRKQFHEKIRNNFSFLDSSTDKENMKVFLLKGQNNVNNNNRSHKNKIRDLSNVNNQKYLIAVLLKRNSDTNFATNFIAKYIHRSPKTIKFAGNKDKRGITAQKISLFSVSIPEIEKAQLSRGWDRKIELSNCYYSDNEYKLGMLNGNQFSVVLRFIEGVTKEEIDVAIDNLKKGFINYFGMQRFGAGHVPTHDIGKAVIGKNWKEACACIIKSSFLQEAVNDTGLQKEIKSVHDLISNDFYIKAVLSKLHRRANIESKILQSLRKSPNNFNNAFKTLNRTLRLIYPHAYQSYIWNLAVSFRIKKYGTSLINGDIVIKDKSKLQNIENNDFDDNDVNNDNDNDNDEGNDFLNNTTIAYDINFNEVFEFINDDNKSKYSVSDLYMPLVGSGVKLPDNDVGEYMKSHLVKDGIDINDMSSMLGKGNYRKVIQIPNIISHELIFHDDSDEELQTEYYNIDKHPETKGSKYTSLRVVFQVPQSTYATMVFRELSKSSSAFGVQSNLTKLRNENK